VSEPEISAIIPVHNGQNTIARAVESALGQHGANLEVVVIDDGSTDDTASVLAGFNGRIRTIHVPRGGPALARNRGVAESRGRFVAFLDADDQWMPGFASTLKNALRSVSHAVLAFSDIVPVDGHGRQVAHFLRNGDRLRAPSMEDLLKQWWPILPSAVMMEKSAFEASGGFPGEFTTPGYEDPWLWLRARELGEFVCVAEPLVAYEMMPELERMGKYARGFDIFSKLVRDRYGAAGERLIGTMRRSFVSTLGYQGLLHLHRGQMAEARSCFSCAMRYQPGCPRNVLRYARTFMPARLASALSGRTRNAGRLAILRFGNLHRAVQ
jgi:glycosyltransferase involved in cell wall biosynthesis